MLLVKPFSAAVTINDDDVDDDNDDVPVPVPRTPLLYSPGPKVAARLDAGPKTTVFSIQFK